MWLKMKTAALSAAAIISQEAATVALSWMDNSFDKTENSEKVQMVSAEKINEWQSRINSILENAWVKMVDVLTDISKWWELNADWSDDIFAEAEGEWWKKDWWNDTRMSDFMEKRKQSFMKKHMPNPEKWEKVDYKETLNTVDLNQVLSLDRDLIWEFDFWNNFKVIKKMWSIIIDWDDSFWVIVKYSKFWDEVMIPEATLEAKVFAQETYWISWIQRIDRIQSKESWNLMLVFPKK